MKNQNKNVNLTLAIPLELRKKMQEMDEVNWSAVIRKLLQQHMERIEIAEKIAQKSKLTEKDAKEISDLIDKEVARKLKLR